jgi:hypothetical protein
MDCLLIEGGLLTPPDICLIWTHGRFMDLYLEGLTEDVLQRGPSYEIEVLL